MASRLSFAPAALLLSGGLVAVVSVIALSVALFTVAGCGSKGGPPGFQSGEGPEIVEGGVIFRYFDEDAGKVHLVGDFNNWSPLSDPMTDKNSDGEWTLFYPLPAGRYEYKFVIDGTYWIPDPRNPASVSDGFDGRNSIVIVPEVRPRS